MKIRLSSLDDSVVAMLSLLPAGPRPRQRRRPHAAHGLEQLEQIACKGLNEQVVRATPMPSATNGMKDAGYQYVTQSTTVGRPAAMPTATSS